MNAADWMAVWLSLQVATCAVLGMLPFAVGLGYMLARWPYRGRWVLETVVNLPLVLPPVVTGWLLLVLLSPRGGVGKWLDAIGVRVVFTWQAAALAAGVVSLPLMTRAARLGFESIDPRLEQAARGLGAGRWRTFFAISLPLARGGVVAGAALGFARALGEFGATIMVAGDIPGETRTLPLAIFSRANQPGGLETSWPLVLVSIALAFGALAVSEWLQRRGGIS
jgi:molybdate transport system permease protein